MKFQNCKKPVVVLVHTITVQQCVVVSNTVVYHNTVLVTKCSSWLIGQKRRSSRNRHRTIEKNFKICSKTLSNFHFSGLKALCLVHKTVARGSCTSCNCNLCFFSCKFWFVNKNGPQQVQGKIWASKVVINKYLCSESCIKRKKKRLKFQVYGMMDRKLDDILSTTFLLQDLQVPHG